jgi:preprotein translocase subunit SecG
MNTMKKINIVYAVAFLMCLLLLLSFSNKNGNSVTFMVLLKTRKPKLTWKAQ